MSRGLSPRAADLLDTVKRAGSGSVNWAGTSPVMRERLCALGLMTHESTTGGHHMWSSYTLTDLGLQTWFAGRFDRGLAVGFAGYCAELDRAAAAERERLDRETCERFDTTPGHVHQVRLALGLVRP